MYCFHCMNEPAEGTRVCPRCGKNPVPVDIPHHLSPGTVLNGRYLVGATLGEGGFGITYIGMDLNLELRVAVKEFYPNGYANRNHAVSNTVTLNYTEEGAYYRKGKALFLREAKNLAKFSGEKSIVDVRDFFTENDTAYIVMEYVEGETLAAYLKREGVFAPEALLRAMLPVMRSLDKIHRAGIIHRDISPDNIMITADGSFKLMDFGAARCFEGDEKKTMSVLLKPGYAPYEQYSTENMQGPWTDVYGLCATIYKCLTGKTPVDSLSRIREDTLQPPSQRGVPLSPRLEQLLLRGMTVFPDQRVQHVSELADAVQNALDSGTVLARQDADAPTTTLPVTDDQATVYQPTPTFRGEIGPQSQTHRAAVPQQIREETAPERPARKKGPWIALLASAAGVLVIALAVLGLLLFNVFGSRYSLKAQLQAEDTDRRNVLVVDDETYVRWMTKEENADELYIAKDTSDDADKNAGHGFWLKAKDTSAADADKDTDEDTDEESDESTDENTDEESDEDTDEETDEDSGEDSDGDTGQDAGKDSGEDKKKKDDGRDTFTYTIGKDNSLNISGGDVTDRYLYAKEPEQRGANTWYAAEGVLYLDGKTYYAYISQQ